MSKWISVKDKLPDVEKEYLVYGNCTNDGFKCDIAWFLHGVFKKFNQPTHWMPLPEPPKD